MGFLSKVGVADSQFPHLLYFNGKVVHHLNSNPEDNSPDNLILLSIADHRRIHAWLNKVQRLEDTLVENSVLEVHDTPKG